LAFSYIQPVYQHQYNPNAPKTRAALARRFGRSDPVYPRLGHHKAHQLAGGYTSGKQQSVLQQLIEEGWTRPEAIEGVETPFLPEGVDAFLEGFMQTLGIGPPGGVGAVGKPEAKGLTSKSGQPTPAGFHEASSTEGEAQAGQHAGEAVSNVLGWIADPLKVVKLLVAIVLIVLAIVMFARASGVPISPLRTARRTLRTARRARRGYERHTTRGRRHAAVRLERREYHAERVRIARREGRRRARREHSSKRSR
jgi:hypothetical protein